MIEKKYVCDRRGVQRSELEMSASSNSHMGLSNNALFGKLWIFSTWLVEQKKKFLFDPIIDICDEPVQPGRNVLLTGCFFRQFKSFELEFLSQVGY